MTWLFLVQNRSNYAALTDVPKCVHDSANVIALHVPDLLFQGLDCEH